MRKTVKSPKVFGVILAIILLLGLSACAEDKEKKTNETNETTESETFSTVETKFGEIEIKEEPKRIVALGWGDAETVLSLGLEPVGASDWLAFGGDGVGPWLEGAYKTSPTILGTMELDYEQIAALEPDLILDVKSSGDEERYKRLSEITTTVGVPEGGENYLTSSEDQVLMIAKALGKVDEGEALLNEVDTAFKEATEKYPEFSDKTIVVGAYDASGFGAYVEGDARVDFATKLGFNVKDEVEALANDNFYISIADEQLELLDADLTIVLPIWIEPSEVTNHELYQKIPSVMDGRSIVLDAEMSNAFSTGTVPALQWIIENLTPQFKEVLGDGEEAQ